MFSSRGLERNAVEHPADTQLKAGWPLPGLIQKSRSDWHTPIVLMISYAYVFVYMSFLVVFFLGFGISPIGLTTKHRGFSLR